MNSICKYILDELYQFDTNFKNIKQNILKIDNDIKEGFYEDDPLEDETP